MIYFLHIITKYIILQYKIYKFFAFSLTTEHRHNRIVIRVGKVIFLSKKGTVLIFTAAVTWGLAGFFVRHLEAYGVSQTVMVFFRCFFTMLIIGAVMLIKDREAFRIKPRDLYLFAANGVFSILMFSYCYYKTMELSTLSVAAVLLYTAPIFVMIMSVFLFREKLTVKKIIALFMAVLGCVLVSGVLNSKTAISAGAVAFGLLTGFGYALYTIFSNLLIRRGYGAFTIIFYTFAFAAAGSGSVALITDAKSIAVSGGGLLWGFLLALFNSVIPYILYTYGLKYTDASKAPVIASVEPVSATVLGLFYGERLNVFGVIGIIAVLSSVVIINMGRGNNENQSQRKNKSHA